MTTVPNPLVPAHVLAYPPKVAAALDRRWSEWVTRLRSRSRLYSAAPAELERLHPIHSERMTYALSLGITVAKLRRSGADDPTSTDTQFLLLIHKILDRRHKDRRG